MSRNFAKARENCFGVSSACKKDHRFFKGPACVKVFVQAFCLGSFVVFDGDLLELMLSNHA